MKKLLLYFLALVGVCALVAGGMVLWMHRPWRVAVCVNGRVLTARELDLRAQTLMDDARRIGNIVVPKASEAHAFANCRRDVAKRWIVKEVLLAEAVARGVTASPGDEKDSLAKLASRLKDRNITPEQFFSEGPMSEELKRRDFREGVLIDKFTKQEIADKIKVKTSEIDAFQQDLQRLSLMKTKPGEKSRIKTDRKTAIDLLRADRFRKGYRKLFRELFGKAEIKVPEFSDLETLDSVSAPMPEDSREQSEENPK